MKPEHAQKELEKLRKPDWLEINLRELDQLPEAVRVVGRRLLGRHADVQDQHDWQKVFKSRRASLAHLAKDSPESRKKLFAVLFPRLESQVEAAWHLNARLPYQVGHGRKPFRAPRHGSLGIHRLDGWLNLLVSAVAGYEQRCGLVGRVGRAPQGWNVADALALLFAAAMNEGGKTGDEVFRHPLRHRQKRARNRPHGPACHPRAPDRRPA